MLQSGPLLFGNPDLTTAYKFLVVVRRVVVKRVKRQLDRMASSSPESGFCCHGPNTARTSRFQLDLG
jgi:hypothetical protein